MKTMTILRYVFVLLTVYKEAFSLYAGSEVIDLNPSNFNQKVIGSDEIWIVEFFAPWCGHCQALVPEYQKAAKALKGFVKVGAVDVDEHKTLGGQYGVRGFPTIKIFGLSKNKPEDYNGPRTSQGLIDSALKAIRDKINFQASGKTGGGGGSGSRGKGNPEDVIELTDGNFDNKVLQSDEMWLVEFFMPQCVHCKNLAPHWQEAATELKGKVKLGALDATVNTIKAGYYNVNSYPTIKFFHKGEVEDYTRGRTASDIIQWASDKLASNVEPPEVLEITSDKILESTCKEHPLCVIAVLPHILDCQSKCRNSYITMLLKMGDKYKQKLWGWSWVEALAQPKLEASLDIGGFGYPALAVLNSKKMQFALLRGSFAYDGINEFLRDISFGRGRTQRVKDAILPALVRTDPWDGKDGIVPVDEEIDLSDVDLDKDEL